MSRFLFNDASLHGQFYSNADALKALGAVLQLRTVLRRASRPLEISRCAADRPLVGTNTLRAVLGADSDRDRQRAVMRWFDLDGPHWDITPAHDAGEYFEVGGEPVTESALAEAAMLLINGGVAATVSLIPSLYIIDPINVFWRARQNGDIHTEVRNFCDEPPLQVYLQSVIQSPASWKELIKRLEAACPSLLLSPDFIHQLPTTFYPNVAERAIILFSVLEETNQAIIRGDVAKRDELIGKWMTGGNSRISNSSQSEIDDFGKDMTFKHPVTDALIPCYWHAKIQTPQYRIHFEWPKANARAPLFVGYFGEKITKR